MPAFYDLHSPYTQMTTTERTTYDWGLGAGIIPDKVLVLDIEATTQYALYVGDGVTVGGINAAGIRTKTDASIYKFDETRSLWLSVHTETFLFGLAPGGTPGFFRGGGGQAMSYSSGYPVIRPSRIVYMGWRAASYTSSPEIEVFRDSTSLFTKTITSNGQDLALNESITTGENVNVQQNSGSLSEFQGVIHIKWEY